MFQKMTIKNLLLIISIVLGAVLIGSWISLIDQNIKLKEKNERIIDNLNQLNVENSELNFTAKELKKYLTNQDTKHKQEVDSILKLLNVKPKQLIKYERIYVSNNDKDTTVASNLTPIIKNDSIYQLKFESVRKCLKIGGYIESKDSNPKIVITDTESNNIIYIIKSYKK